MESKNILGIINIEYILLTFSVIGIFLSFFYSFKYLSEPRLVNFIFAIPFFFILTPYLFIKLYQVKTVESKMDVVPRFFRDIVDGMESGLEFVSSIKMTRNNEYGSLNIDIKKLINRLSWGVDIDTALIKFSKDVGSRELLRDMLLVIEARKVGGHLDKMFKEISEKISQEILRKKEIKNALASNTMTGYISFGIFLFIIVITFNSLFTAFTNPSMLSNKMLSSNGNSGDVYHKINIFKSVLTILSYEMSILSGLLFGFMSENRMVAGAPHVVMLATLTFLTFFIFI